MRAVRAPASLTLPLPCLARTSDNTYDNSNDKHSITRINRNVINGFSTAKATATPAAAAAAPTTTTTTASSTLIAHA